MGQEAAIVVGAAGNLGPFWIETLLEEKYKVYGFGQGIGKDVQLKLLANQFGNRLELVEVDVCEPSWTDTIQSCIARDPTIRVVVINAGVDTPPDKGTDDVTIVDIKLWEQIFNVNVFAAVRTIASAANALIGRESPAIITVGSIYAAVSPNPSLYSHFNEGRGLVKNVAYGASKAALLAASKQFATHLASSGIRINTISPGGVYNGQDEKFREKFENATPAGRMASVKDLRVMFLALCTRENPYLIGQNIVVDGGYSVW